MVAKHHDLRVLIDEITEELNDVAEANLLIAVRNGKDWAVRYWLENRGQSRGYGIRKLAFKDGEGNVAIPALLVTDGRMTTDDWEKKYGTTVPADAS